MTSKFTIPGAADFPAGTDPVAVIGAIEVYAKVDGGGDTQLWARASDGSIYQLTPTGNAPPQHVEDVQTGTLALSVPSATTNVLTCPSVTPGLGDTVQVTGAVQIWVQNNSQDFNVWPQIILKEDGVELARWSTTPTGYPTAAFDLYAAVPIAWTLTSDGLAHVYTVDVLSDANTGGGSWFAQDRAIYVNVVMPVSGPVGPIGPIGPTGPIGPAGASGSSIGSFGAGTDGALAFDGVSVVLGLTPAASVYSLNRHIFPSSIVISAGVTINLRNFAIICDGNINGGAVSLINGQGNNGSNGTAVAGGAGATATAAGNYIASTAGGPGAIGAAAPSSGGNSSTAPFGFTAGSASGASLTIGNSGNPGQGGAGGGNGVTGSAAGGAVTLKAATTGPYPQASLERAMTGRGLDNVQWSSGGGGSGGRGSVGVGGGGGGGGGTWTAVVAKTYSGTVTITANGGTGGNSFSPGAAGGGGGGAGGIAVIGVGSGAGPTVTAAGGAGGAGSGAGGAGGTGGAGLLLMFD